MENIPIGIDDFKELISNNYYYVDKTDWMSDILKEKVALYTRPRRFGKTLNMSMLYYFFSNKEDGKIFKGLNITSNKETMKHMNQYPTIFISLKDMENINLSDQIEKFESIISQIMIQNIELITSPHLVDIQKKILNQYLNREASLVDLKEALLNISICLKQHYNKNTIILIDEYDVPLKSVYTNGYYDDMVGFLRGVFSSALKSNKALQKGILTGCLRISRESIFTGINNFNVYSMMEEASSTYFGFTQEEVNTLLDNYNLGEYKEEVKVWYDGYQFASNEIYNPWSVLKYANKGMQETPKPECFWANTSGNDLVMDYIQHGGSKMYEEFESLISGKTISKQLKLELTYKDMDDLGNVYSFLLLTGYLKVVKSLGSRQYELKIPNHEIKELYEINFMNHFKDYIDERKSDFVSALVKKDISKAQDILSEILFKHISYFDNHENFYHGLLTGLLSDYRIQSNKEIGEGRPDIVVLPQRPSETAIVIECKQSKDYLEIEKDSELGAKQIKDNKYIEGVIAYYGYKEVVGYGMSFYKKRCHITLVE